MIDGNPTSTALGGNDPAAMLDDGQDNLLNFALELEVPTECRQFGRRNL